MKDYMFLFRGDYKQLSKASPEEMQARTKRWMDWAGSIAAQDKLSSIGNRLNPEGKVLKKSGVVTDGPFTEIKETILGYLVVKATTFEEAVQLTTCCPALSMDHTSAEVRELLAV